MLKCMLRNGVNIEACCSNYTSEKCRPKEMYPIKDDQLRLAQTMQLRKRSHMSVSSLKEATSLIIQLHQECN